MPEWLTSITDWIRQHPHLAGVTIGLVAYLEGLALVGILIPGIIILFAFGALVGLGVLDLATVWIWCSVGAILGDATSFWLGHHYKGHIREIWPFTKFSDLFARGEVFFRKHGLKSIIIGRFVGPIRPIMPVVAGMLGMDIKKYIPANIVAGILWAPAYLIPGVVFGASLELAKAVALRLAILLALVAGVVWLLSWLAGTLYRYLAPRTSRMLSYAMRWSREHPVLGYLARPLVDPTKPESGTLALFALFLSGATAMLATSLITIPLTEYPRRMNLAVAQFMESLSTPWADVLMAWLAAPSHPYVLIAAAITVMGWLLWRRRLTAAYHWAGALLVGALLAVTIKFTIADGSAQAVLHAHGPAFDYSAWASVVYGFFAILIASELPQRRRIWPYLVAVIAVALSVFSDLYFGIRPLTHLWIGQVVAVVWIAVIGIAYRRRVRRSFWTAPVARLFFATVLISAGVYVWLGVPGWLDDHRPVPQTIVVSSEVWRAGGVSGTDLAPSWLEQELAVTNFQWAGSPIELQRALEPAGWMPPRKATWAAPIEMIQPEPSPETLPILPSSVAGQSEALVLHRIPKGDEGQRVLRIWSSPFRLDDGTPIWIGQVSRFELSQVLRFFSYWEAQQPTMDDLRALQNSLPAEAVVRSDDQQMLLRQP